MFLGEFQHIIDPKGRVILPAKFRESLADGLVITAGEEGCLYVFPVAEWQKVVDRYEEAPRNAETRRLYRVIFSSASKDTIDRQGRLFIPQPLRDFAHLSKDVIVIGVSNRVEIWDKRKWLGYRKETEKSMTEGLADLGI